MRVSHTNTIMVDDPVIFDHLKFLQMIGSNVIVDNNLHTQAHAEMHG